VNRGIMVSAQILNFPEPASLVNLKGFEAGNVIRCPHFLNKISAGFPSPADDYIESRLSLDEKYIEHPSATFFFTVSGDSMETLISNGDLLVVDRAIVHNSNLQGKVVVVVVDGEYMVKRYFKRNGKHVLVAENKNYPDREIKEGNQFEIWGVVKNIIKSNF
jgi:DNA polymerase V